MARCPRPVGIPGRVAMTRTASCQCRGFRVVVEAEPDTVAICHCQICQRRTGVPLTCNAYFPKSKVRLEGEHRIYTRECPEGRKLHNHFCPTCLSRSNSATSSSACERVIAIWIMGVPVGPRQPRSC